MPPWRPAVLHEAAGLLAAVARPPRLVYRGRSVAAAATQPSRPLRLIAETRRALEVALGRWSPDAAQRETMTRLVGEDTATVTDLARGQPARHLLALGVVFAGRESDSRWQQAVVSLAAMLALEDQDAMRERVAFGHGAPAALPRDLVYGLRARLALELGRRLEDRRAAQIPQPVVQFVRALLDCDYLECANSLERIDELEVRCRRALRRSVDSLGSRALATRRQARPGEQTAAGILLRVLEEANGAFVSVLDLQRALAVGGRASNVSSPVSRLNNRFGVVVQGGEDERGRTAYRLVRGLD